MEEKKPHIADSVKYDAKRGNDPMTHLSVLGSLHNDLVHFAVCRNEETREFFLSSSDVATQMGTILFVHPEELRKFARGIIKVLGEVN